MDSNRLIDAQFDRAVEIVQGLPKTGPIQTSYEEKLAMYSLYKQATVGNVTTSRPGVWDMLGRAKWDEWAKHKDLDTHEAKWLYVEALLKVLRKYSDKTVANKLVEELELYGGGPSPATAEWNRVLSKSSNSDSSGSAVSGGRAHPLIPPSKSPHLPQRIHDPQDEVETTTEEETDDEGQEPVSREPHLVPRPPSSSSHRYRTPMAGSLAMSPQPSHMSIPATQPLPGFETPSAFAEPTSHSFTSSLYPPTSTHSGQPSRTTPSPGNIQHPRFRGQSQPVSSRQYGTGRPTSQPTLERAVENLQGHLAALTERLELLEANGGLRHRSNVSLATGGSSPLWGGASRGSPAGRRDSPEWDLDDLGMWSIVLNPLSRGITFIRELAVFFARNENRSPALIVVRRLCLDASFLLCVLAVVRAVWRKSGVRRREVRAALKVLWRAILGSKERAMIDRGV